MRLPVQAIGTAREDSANLRTVKACSRVTPGSHSRNWSTVAPRSRFSKSACTGTRVPLNTHAPLTLPGTRSTAVHIVQSNMHRTVRCHPDTSKREAHFRSSGGAPAVEEFARFAFEDVEMGPLCLPAGYCRLSSVCARSSASFGQEVRLTCNQLAGGLSPFPRMGCFWKARQQCFNCALSAKGILRR